MSLVYVLRVLLVVNFVGVFGIVGRISVIFFIILFLKRNGVVVVVGSGWGCRGGRVVVVVIVILVISLNGVLFDVGVGVRWNVIDLEMEGWVVGVV